MSHTLYLISFPYSFFFSQSHISNRTPMKKTRGFRLGKKLVGFWTWVLKRKRKSSYNRLNHPDRQNKTITKICSWGRCLKRKLICSSRPLKPLDYSRLDQTQFECEPVTVPKGHLAVYVGQKDDDFHRFLVPVIYFNHPLFGKLLKEAEDEFGYHHPGGITIPCRISEFENVQTRIAGDSCRKLAGKRRF
ncbi:auxin-responsive protein SAUR36-like [Tasmannia lanceolata]|uniref:auxin-responsive protein SAUR36-like n=1 Tax=Tasmannia lanceolata TaxID=3420 RepID=UPI0040646160